jgi:repressor LexA
VPLIGRVHAGNLTFAEENLDEIYSFSDNLFGAKDLFMLTVVGESMIDAGINDGDMVVVKKQQTANNGQIVVALVNDEATVKRFYKKNNYFLLHPENKEFDDIVVLKLDILGVVVGLVRKFR